MDDFQDQEEQKKTGMVAGMLRSLAEGGPFAKGRSAFGRWDGISFQGRRDAYEAYGYTRVLTPAHYRARYDRGGICGRIVDALPEACWRGDGLVYEDEDPTKETAFEKAFKDLDARLGIWAKFLRVDKLAGLGRYAIIFIGGPGNVDEPLERCSPDQIMYLDTYSEEDAKITRYVTDPRDPRFARGEQYTLTRNWQSAPGGATPMPSVPAFPVHWSRVIHVADGLLDDDVFGQPRLRRPWNLLDCLDKVTGGGSESFYKRADGGTQFDFDKDMKLPVTQGKTEAESLAAMQTMFDDFTHDLKKNITTRGMTITRLGSDVADFKSPAEAILAQICAAVDMPQDVLIGTAQGVRSGAKTKNRWDDRVQDRRDSYCRHVIVNQFVDRLIGWGALPKAAQYKPNWPEIDELDQGQRVSATVQLSTVNKNEATPVFTPSELRDVAGFEPLTPEQITEVEKIKAEKQAALDAMKPAPTATAAKDGGVIDGRAPLTDNPTSLAAASLDMRALEMALIDDNLELAEQIVADALVVTEPEVEIPVAAPISKIIEYAEIGGMMRPVRIVEEKG